MTHIHFFAIRPWFHTMKWDHPNSCFWQFQGYFLMMKIRSGVLYFPFTSQRLVFYKTSIDANILFRLITDPSTENEIILIHFFRNFKDIYHWCRSGLDLYFMAALTLQLLFFTKLPLTLGFCQTRCGINAYHV